MHDVSTWLDLPSVLRRTILGKTSIYKLLAEGKLEGRKFGRKIVVSAESVDKFMAALPRFGEAA